jgi:hypothetical protein
MVATACEEAKLASLLIMFQPGLCLLHLCVALVKIRSLLTTTKITHLMIGYNFSDLTCSTGSGECHHAGRQLMMPRSFMDQLHDMFAIARSLSDRVTWIVCNPAGSPMHANDKANASLYQDCSEAATRQGIHVETPDLAALHKPDGVHLCAKQCSASLEVCLHEIAASVAAHWSSPGYAFEYHKYNSPCTVA